MEKIRIQDDLYNYVNSKWLETAIIPEDRPTAGGFADIDKNVEELLINELNDMCQKNAYPNSYLENACKIYNAFKNVKKRKRQGVKPVLKTLNKIEKLTDIASFNRNLKDFILDGIILPFNISVEPDLKDTDHYCLTIQGPSTILPDVIYYKDEMAAQRDALLGVWQNMAQAILAKLNLNENEINSYISDCLAFDKIISTLVKSSEEWSEYVKCYNPMKLSRVNSMLKPISFKRNLEKLLGYTPETIIVAEPRFLKGFNTLFNEDTFILYKHWAYVKEIISASNYLTEELRELGSIYSRALTGVSKISTAEKFAYNLAGAYFSEPIGLYYGEKYFGEAAKKDVIDMVKDIIETYKRRVKENDFLEEATKEKAILKLSTMNIKMGYPDKIDPIYDKFIVDEKDSVYEMASKIQRIKREDSYKKLNQLVDRSEWAMPGHMVNACYNPTSNDITFPAAILQGDFYDVNRTRSENLGGIGAVIGHEISHAFDNNGAKCDEKGNLNNWWTKNDLKNFNKKTKDMIKEFEGIELPFGKVNSSLIVSENIADNGGMAVTLDIMSRLNDADYEKYFITWAKVWCMKAKPEFQALLLQVDVHAPAILRANMQPRNFEQWYSTFNVKKTDKMFIPSKKRVVIW